MNGLCKAILWQIIWRMLDFEKAWMEEYIIRKDRSTVLMILKNPKSPLTRMQVELKIVLRWVTSIMPEIIQIYS